MSGSDSEAYLAFALTPGDETLDFQIDSFVAEEELGRPFRYELELSCPTAKTDLQALLGQSGTVTATLPDKSKRYFNGIVAEIAYRGRIRGAFRYRIELRPWIWLLSRTQDCAIFQNQSVYDTITNGVFTAKGFTSFKDARQASAGSTSLEYCVQYRETALDFVTRLMERYGLYYFFEHSNGSHTLVLADDQNSHPALAKSIPYSNTPPDWRKLQDYIWNVSSDLALQPGKYTHKGYNFTIPNVDLSGVLADPGSHESYNSLEIFDYPADFTTLDLADSLAKIRMQALASRRQILGGTTNARGLAVGKRFTLEKCEPEDANHEYLVIKTVTRFSLAEGTADQGGALTDTYRCEFHAMRADIPFRLAMETPRPFVQGPQSAKVVGLSGEEITTDQYGRIKVKFYWDRVGQENENASCWIRVCQPWAGTGWGSIFLPRQGQEVIVDFIEGNPDRPIVTGMVYNATNKVPYALDTNKTRSTIKTQSSKDASGFNELRFEDKAGSEEVFMQAQKDYHKVVLNNDIVDITNDTTTTVKNGKRSVTVQTGDNSLTVSTGNNSTTVSTGNDSLTVSTGNHSITVSAGASSITAGQSITLSVGGSSVTIAPDGVTISAPMVTISGKGAVTVSGKPIALN